MFALIAKAHESKALGLILSHFTYAIFEVVHSDFLWSPLHYSRLIFFVSVVFPIKRLCIKCSSRLSTILGRMFARSLERLMPLVQDLPFSLHYLVS